MLHLHNILSSVWLIDQAYAANYLPLVAHYLRSPQSDFGRPRNALTEHELTADNALLFAVKQADAYQISEYGEYRAPEDAPEQSVAILSIEGAISKYDQGCGPAGMLTKSDLLHRCYANDNIIGIVLHIDSGGGEGMACRLMQQAIGVRNKPVVAFCDDFAASAAYGIAAACDTVVANSDLCRVGSVGTYVTLVDYADYYAKMGIKLIDVYASRSTDKNQDYLKALQGDTAPMRVVCDRFNEAFIASIATARDGKIEQDQQKWATGKLFFADEALKLGLIDQIDTIENVINYFNV